MIDLSFVIITLNDADRLWAAVSSAALRSVEAGLSYEVWVVDNGSEDHTGQVLAALGGALGERLKVIRLAKNTGTTYSRNLALQQARGDFLCVLDSDAEMVSSGLGDALSLLAAVPQAGIVAPRILVPGGSVYDSVKRLPTLGDKLLKLPGIFLGGKKINRDWYPDFPFEHIRCVDTAISCCWLLRKDTYELVGPLDERIFYAPEDVDFCLRTWQAGRAVVYFPELTVMHHTRQTSHRRPLSRIAMSHLGGLLYYYAKHGYVWQRDKAARLWITPRSRQVDPLLRKWESDR